MPMDPLFTSNYGKNREKHSETNAEWDRINKLTQAEYIEIIHALRDRAVKGKADGATVRALTVSEVYILRRHYIRCHQLGKHTDHYAKKYMNLRFKPDPAHQS